MSPLEQYMQDLPAFVRGTLEPARARAIREAAAQNESLARAIEEERALDRLLNLYDVPEPPIGLETRFWQRFHSEGMHGGRRLWLMRAAGALAASILVAVGLLVYFGGPREHVLPEPGIASTTELDADEDEADPVLWSEWAYVLDAPQAPVRPERRPDLRTLELLKLLDDASLDGLEDPDDLLVAENLELLIALAELEDES
jgi:hypothetical protein